MSEIEKVDIVITWVDGADPEWVAERDMWKSKLTGEPVPQNMAVRYRDWDNLQYIFRGIEEFMPWVNKVHLVTWGHLPKWLNTDNDKLNIVNHKDFIPEEYLPTFNSDVIDVNLFRIPGLADRFIYFNDDMFVIKKTDISEFVINGIPCDMAAVSPQPIQSDSIAHIELNNLQVLNENFTVNDIKRNKSKWLKFGKYGQFAIRTFIFMHFSTIIGIFEPHVPLVYDKNTIKEVWDKEFDVFDKTSRNKFREPDEVSLWLTRQWKLMKGEFLPRTHKFGRYISASDPDGVKAAINDKACKLVCINDDSKVTDLDVAKQKINSLLDQLLPNKSSFEK